MFGPGEERHTDGERDDDWHDGVSSPAHSDHEQHTEDHRRRRDKK
jgi:hypothetical protein